MSNLDPNAFLDLPFVIREGRGKNKTWSNWSVETTGDFVRDCAHGRIHAGHYMQYLLDNPGAVGAPTLGAIVSHIDFSDKSVTGYWVGFFSAIESVMFRGVDKPIVDKLLSV